MVEVFILKEGTRCGGKVYTAGDVVPCLPEQAAKLYALGRAEPKKDVGSADGSCEATDTDATVGDDAVGSDDDGDAGP